MNTVAQNPVNAPIFEIPDPPEEFGQDGGKFYRAYDTIAEEIDEDLTKKLKEQLDGMLIFAGLFAGVNSAFLVLTLPLMSADPVDDTNALLAQNNAILLQLVSGSNDTPSLNSTLPSASFAPSGAILSVNVLFALSLSFAIASSFLAVLGRQWLVYYRKRGGGGPDHQRWEQLKRFRGAERWGLELILDDILPSLLQIGLIIFCISLIIYLSTLNSTLSWAVGAPLYMGLALFVGSALSTLWDRFCPFHSPLSHLLHRSFIWIFRVITFLKTRLSRQRIFAPPSEQSWESYQSHGQAGFANRFLGWLKRVGRSFRRAFGVVNTTIKKWFSHVPWTRREEDKRSLEVIAVQRTICTSEDPGTLLHAAANILSISDVDQLKQLWGDELFRERFVELRRTSCKRAMALRGRDQFELAASAARLYCASATHVLISVHSPEVDSADYFMIKDFPIVDGTMDACFWLPRDRLASCSPLLILASLVSSTIPTFWYSRNNDKAKDFGVHLDAYCAALNGQSWRILSLIAWLISRLPQHGESLVFWQGKDLESLRKLYVGSDDTTSLANLDSALRTSYVGSTKTIFEDLDSAFTALLDPLIESLLDRDSILTNLLRCLVQILDDKQERQRINPKQMFELMATCERVLRRIQSSEEARQMLGELRICGKTAINDLLSSPTARLTRIPWEILDALITYFKQQLSIVREERQAPGNENFDVLQTFSPLIRQILLFKPMRWENVSRISFEPGSYPDGLQEKRSAARQTFNNFASEVDKVFCNIHNNRDPELSWCHWRGECIVDLYSLP